MELEGFLPWFIASDPYPETDESSSHLHPLFISYQF
jgi:hypothetical protein